MTFHRFGFVLYRVFFSAATEKISGNVIHELVRDEKIWSTNKKVERYFDNKVERRQNGRTLHFLQGSFITPEPYFFQPYTRVEIQSHKVRSDEVRNYEQNFVCN